VPNSSVENESNNITSQNLDNLTSQLKFKDMKLDNSFKSDLKNLLNSLSYQPNTQDNQKEDLSNIQNNCNKYHHNNDTKSNYNDNNSNVISCKQVNSLNFNSVLQTIQSIDDKQSDYDNKLDYLKRFD
jgi:hypothetical protein